MYKNYVEKLKSVTPALLTPLNRDGSLDEPGMERLVKYLVGKGCRSLFILGYTGEVRAFDREERRRITEVVRHAAGDEVLITAGVCGDSTHIIQQFSEDAWEAGADMTLITPTDFFFLTDEELRNLFLKLADDAKKPFMIYNCPENHHYVKPELMAELSRHDNIIALKQSTSTDKIQQMQMALDSKEDFVMISGDEFNFYPAMTLGVEAFIMGGPGNIMPARCISMFEDYKAGKRGHLLEEHMKLVSFFSELYYTLPYPMVISQIKAVMEIGGICGRWMRHPVREVTDADMKVIEDMMKRHNIEL